MQTRSELDRLDRRDLQLLAGIARGPGHYPTPSPKRAERLIERGLVRRKRSGLTPTAQGRVFA
jgi:hypothetical protein